MDYGLTGLLSTNALTSLYKLGGAGTIMRFRNDGFKKCSKDSRYGVLQKI